MEREALAIKWALQELCYYLLGRRFTLVTDQAPLQWMARAKDSNARITRWFLSLQDFCFDVSHHSGTQHGNADGLSRLHTLMGSCAGPAWDPPVPRLHAGGDCDVTAT